jgi:hypothetical protein
VPLLFHTTLCNRPSAYTGALLREFAPHEASCRLCLRGLASDS